MVQAEFSLTLNKDFEAQSPQSEDGGCPKNSAQKAITQNIKASTRLKYTSGGGEGLVERWVNLFLFAGFIPKGDIRLYLQNWCREGDMPHEAEVDLSRQKRGDVYQESQTLVNNSP